MKSSKQIIAITLCIAIVLSSLSGCSNQLASEDGTTSPNISVTIVDEPTTLPDKEATLLDEANGNITSLVYSAVNYDLQDLGYETTDCVAFSSDETYTAVGIGYHDPELQFFSNEEYEAHGFVTIIGPEDDYQSMPTECEYIAVEPLEGDFDNGALYNIVAYSCESIGYSHFVYENQYVIYYQLDSTTVRYETFENKRENYDLSLGSLYDFDNNAFIYDASLFDGYETHSAIELFSEEDYDALEDELQAISDMQEKNGYYVEELNVVYISPESIRAYLASEEEDTFFGYSVAELESSIGLGSALVFTDNGFEVAEYYEENPGEYDWKSFLTKVGIGTGIILVGAILTPITGGASFGCALVTITKITITASLVSGVSTLAIGTASGMLQGKSFEEALRGATHQGLDAFANTFLITAVVTSIGVTTGMIKPTACFPAGTPVSVVATTGEILNIPIEDISIGDQVATFDEYTQAFETNTVVDTLIRETDSLVYVLVDGETIVATPDHPFYHAKKHCWISAANLSAGDWLLTTDGPVLIEKVSCKTFDIPVTVYNLTVAQNHTYCVGTSEVVVHNACDPVANARRRGVDRAWSKEVTAVKNGTSKYNWTLDEIDELLTTGRVSGYEGCHIVDVSVDPSLADNADNIIFLLKEVHLKVVHGGDFHNASRWGEIIKIMPQFKDQILAIGGLL